MKYNTTTYAVKKWLPLAIIKQATEQNWLDSLIYFLWLKSIYKHSIFYNYSLRRVSALISCSPATLSHHLTILIKHGLCSVRDGHLHLVAARKIPCKKSPFVPVKLNYNKAEQRDLLRYTLINRNLFTQCKAFHKKNETLLFVKGVKFNYKDTIRIHKKLKHLNLHEIENSITDVLTLSNKKFGTICNRSQSTGMKIQRAMNRLNLLVSETRTKIVAIRQNRASFFSMELNGSYFIGKNGCVYQRLTNRLTIATNSM